ncbi:DUF3136 domain-containing protein [Agrobacterium vitis]|nr:DUF3136 domain-containing protein [Agrobacterium vitis]
MSGQPRCCWPRLHDLHATLPSRWRSMQRLPLRTERCASVTSREACLP